MAHATDRETERMVRKGFDQMIAAASAAEDRDAVARLEISREYYTSPGFRRALEQRIWDINQRRVACCGDAACYNEDCGVPCSVSADREAV